MADRRTNLAYDLSRYEEYEERASYRKNNIQSRRTAAKPKPIIAAPVLMLLIAATFGMFTVCVNAKAAIAAVHAEIVSAESDVHVLEQENISMQTRLEQKSSQKVVEDYAENILGMQKLDPNAQVEYISLESGNKVEIDEENTSFAAKLKFAFNSFVEYLKG